LEPTVPGFIPDWNDEDNGLDSCRSLLHAKNSKWFWFPGSCCDWELAVLWTYFDFCDRCTNELRQEI